MRWRGISWSAVAEVGYIEGYLHAMRSCIGRNWEATRGGGGWRRRGLLKRDSSGSFNEEFFHAAGQAFFMSL
jgi:hypothetical protein